MKQIRALVFTCLTLLSACASYDTPGAMLMDGVTGGLVAGGIGAGTGALIGSVIANGDIGASALAGGAIGAGVGIIATVGYHSAKTGLTIRNNQSQINKNAKHLAANQRQIDALRKNLEAQSADIPFDESAYDHVYDGPTLGQAVR